jgi:hypothetical protein
MKYFHLIWKNLWRRKVRTIFTLAAISSAFVLYGLLAAVKLAFSMGVDLTGVDRLVTINKVSLIQPLPYAYDAKIRAVPGVTDAAHATWFGAYYQDKSNFFAQFPVDPESYLRMFPELLLPEDQKQAWLADRTGAIVGRTIANQYGFQIGQRVPLISPWPRKDGAQNWEFTIVGIYDGAEKGTDTTQFLFHYDYFNENRRTFAGGADTVGWYTVRVADPEKAPQIAKAIDAQFANSPAETETTTEKAFAQGFANQVGNVGAIVQAIVAAGGGQHHGAGGARAHQRARGAQDPGLHRQRRPRPGAGGVAGHRRGGRLHRPRAVLARGAGLRPGAFRVPADLLPAAERLRLRRGPDRSRRPGGRRAACLAGDAAADRHRSPEGLRPCGWRRSQPSPGSTSRTSRSASAPRWWRWRASPAWWRSSSPCCRSARASSAP